MKTKNIPVNLPKNQINLYGYAEYFHKFIEIYKEKKIGKAILLEGPKGIGKATFVYHFVNYILSQNEENEYSISNFKINSNNITYNLINNNTHPNLFIIENNTYEDNVKIEQVRKLLKFLNKTTYSKNLKIVIIDNLEFLNLNSFNALLKSLEEPTDNTIFFLINDSSKTLLDTIKSRCFIFKINFNMEKKSKILNSLLRDYDLKNDFLESKENLLFDTPGQLLKLLSFFKDVDFNFLKDKYKSISYLIDKYNESKDNDILTMMYFMIEHFYRENSFKNINNIEFIYNNKMKILNAFKDMKTFNLDKKNLSLIVNGILENEAR